MRNQETMNKSVTEKEARPSIAASLAILGFFFSAVYVGVMGEEDSENSPIFFIISLIGTIILYFSNMRQRVRNKKKNPESMDECRSKVRLISSWFFPALSTGLASIFITANNSLEICRAAVKYADPVRRAGLPTFPECSEINIPLVALIAFVVSWFFLSVLVVLIWIFSEPSAYTDLSFCQRVLGSVKPLLGVLSFFLPPLIIVFLSLKFGIVLSPIREICYVVASAWVAAWGVSAWWKWIETSPQEISHQPQQWRPYLWVLFGLGAIVSLVLWVIARASSKNN